jgi:hypothetical protein
MHARGSDAAGADTGTVLGPGFRPKGASLPLAHRHVGPPHGGGMIAQEARFASYLDQNPGRLRGQRAGLRHEMSRWPVAERL